MEYKEIELRPATAEELAAIEDFQRSWQEEVARMLGVPADKMGEPGSANYASLYQELQAWR